MHMAKLESGSLLCAIDMAHSSSKDKRQIIGYRLTASRQKRKLLSITSIQCYSLSDRIIVRCMSFEMQHSYCFQLFFLGAQMKEDFVAHQRSHLRLGRIQVPDNCFQ